MTTYTQIPYSPDIEPAQHSYGKEKYLKVPVVMVGEWDHPEYGKVKFDQDDINQIVNNWENGAAGYDVSLWKGHPIDTTAIEGQESEGWLQKLQQEGDVLWGYYQPTDPDLFSKVASKKFKYASAEVIRDAKDKKTGKPLGTMLVGDALTNRPFLPFKDITLEVVREALCDSTSQTHVFTFQITPNTMQDNIQDKVTAPEATTPEVTQSFSDKAVSNDYVSKEEYNKLLVKLADAASSLDSQAKEMESMRQLLSDLHQKEKERELAADLLKLESLTLEARTKQVFSDMFKSGTMTAEAKAALFQGAAEQSSATIEKFTTVEGTLEPEVNAERANKPAKRQVFAEVLEQSKKIAEQRGFSVVPSSPII